MTLLRFFNEIPVLDYTDSVAAQFEDLRRSKLRVGSMDLKIASITLSHDGLLLSSNLRDFSQVPELRVEDWTK
jgi:tRNA(fMet)-specific endonuclease VapC